MCINILLRLVQLNEEPQTVKAKEHMTESTLSPSLCGCGLPAQLINYYVCMQARETTNKIAIIYVCNFLLLSSVIMRFKCSMELVSLFGRLELGPELLVVNLAVVQCIGFIIT